MVSKVTLTFTVILLLVMFYLVIPPSTDIHLYSLLKSYFRKYFLCFFVQFRWCMHIYKKLFSHVVVQNIPKITCKKKKKSCKKIFSCSIKNLLAVTKEEAGTQAIIAYIIRHASFFKHNKTILSR